MESIKYSIIVPIYNNEESIPHLLANLNSLNEILKNQLEVLFINDDSTDSSFLILNKNLEKLLFSAKIINHSKNFGSFSAIRTGLEIARGNYLTYMSADCQEPNSLIISFFTALEKEECDIVIGKRKKRRDPFFNKIAANLFWWFYRKFIFKEMPEGGVDIFGCNKLVKGQLLQLKESRSSLVALLFWIGFKRKYIEYEREQSKQKKSGWSFFKKLNYAFDSFFSFSNCPISFLVFIGFIGITISLILGLTVLVKYFFGAILIPGYTALILTILFFGGLNILAVGLVGVYVWRIYENSKNRPLGIISKIYTNEKNTDSQIG
jgi:glycosyltransferase involved in cell wall biosynthesis